MPTLLELSEDLLAFSSLIDECDGELTAETEQALTVWFEELGEARDEKLDNYAALIRSTELRAAVRREEMDRLARRVSVDENTAAKLKERLQLFMTLQKTKRIETRRYKLSVQGNGGLAPLKIEVEPDLLPPHLQHVEIKANTEAIRKALEAGQEVRGARLLPRGSHLRIT